MSDMHDPARTDIYPETAAQRSSGRTVLSLTDPVAVAELAETIATAEGWRASRAITLLSIEEIAALARFAWASSFVVTASMGFEQAAIDGDALREADKRVELAAAHDAFMARFLPPDTARAVG